MCWWAQSTLVSVWDYNDVIFMQSLVMYYSMLLLGFATGASFLTHHWDYEKKFTVIMKTKTVVHYYSKSFTGLITTLHIQFTDILLLI